MTTIQPAPSTAIDAANGLLDERPAQFITSTLAVPGHPRRVVLTIRTETTTLTVLVPKGDALRWAAQLNLEAAALPDSGLITANGS